MSLSVFFFSINTELPDMNISMMYALLEVASVTFVIKSLHFYILSRLYWRRVLTVWNIGPMEVTLETLLMIWTSVWTALHGRIELLILHWMASKNFLFLIQESIIRLFLVAHAIATSLFACSYLMNVITHYNGFTFRSQIRVSANKDFIQC